MQDDGLTQNLLLVQTHLHSLELNISFKQGKLRVPDRHKSVLSMKNRGKVK